MWLRAPVVVFLFALGAVAGLVGDHCHVITGTTEYLAPAQRVPFIWSSPIWFPIVVGMATVMLAGLRLRLPAVRGTVTLRGGLAGVAAVMGTYAVTALMHGTAAAATTVLICALAVITWCALGDGMAALCGVVAAIFGLAAEVALAAAGLFRYGPGSDSLFGVAPWLPALYFAFGVVAALLGEIADAKQLTKGKERTLRGGGS